MSRNRKLVPASRDALYQMKYEIAAELGINVVNPRQRQALGDVSSEFGSELGESSGSASYATKDYWGHLSSRDAGSVGGGITRRLVQEAQRTIL